MTQQQLTLDEEVDAFWAEKPQRTAPPLTTRITCRVCDRKEDIPILAAGRLCGHCRRDLDATERHIRETLAAVEQALEDAQGRWEATYAQADLSDQGRYHVVCEARAAASAGFAAKYQRALDRGDGLSVLLRAKATCDEVAARAQGRLAAWAGQALEEVREARE